MEINLKNPIFLLFTFVHYTLCIRIANYKKFWIPQIITIPFHDVRHKYPTRIYGHWVGLIPTKTIWRQGGRLMYMRWSLLKFLFLNQVICD